MRLINALNTLKSRVMHNRTSSKTQPPSHTRLEFPFMTPPQFNVHRSKFKVHQSERSLYLELVEFFKKWNAGNILELCRLDVLSLSLIIRAQSLNWSVVLRLKWSKVLCPSSPSPSSPATLIAGVLCRGPTQEYSCDPERGTRPEHGGLSAPADTGSRAANTPDQRAAQSAAPNRKFRPKNISQSSVQRARRLHGRFTRGICGVWGRKSIWREVFVKKKEAVCVRARARCRTTDCLKNFCCVRSDSRHRGARASSGVDWVTRERSLQTTPTHSPERCVSKKTSSSHFCIKNTSTKLSHLLQSAHQNSRYRWPN